MGNRATLALTGVGGPNDPHGIIERGANFEGEAADEQRQDVSFVPNIQNREHERCPAR